MTMTALPCCLCRTLLATSLVFLIQATQLSAQTPAGPIIKDGQAQVVPAFKDPDYWVRHDLFVETEFDTDGDGKLDRMHVDVTRPRQTESEGLKVPVIYNSSPYFAGTAKADKEHFWDVKREVGSVPPVHTMSPPVKQTGTRPVISKRHVKDWVPRGFAVVHSSSPGTGLSQGCPTVGGPNESLAPKAVVQWLCGKATGYTSLDGDETVEAYWSTGKVGMTGTSYNGTLCLAAACTGVEGLKAIIPVAPNTSYYHYYRSNGLVRSPGGYQGEDIDVLYDFIHSGDTKNDEFCDCGVRDEVMLKNFDRVTGDYNAFWKGRDYVHQVANVKAAVLMSHAFNDWNVVPEHSVRIVEQLRKDTSVPLQTYFHQGGHGGPPPMKLMNRWFTRYLMDVENGVESDARSWVVREKADQKNPTAYDNYPHPDADPVTLHLTAGAPGAGTLSATSVEHQPNETLVDNVSFSGGSLATAEFTEHRLIYKTPLLSAPLHLSGTARVRVRLASNKPAANLSVWLVSLPWNPSKRAKVNDNLITRGWADPQNHDSIESSQPLVPGEFYDVQFDLQPDDQIIPAGQAIGLMIMSSDREFTLWPKPGTELTIDLGGTAITLPIVGGSQAFDAALKTSESVEKP